MEPPDFPILDLGGGSKKKRYPLQFKVKAVRYSQKRIKGAQGPGGTPVITYAGRILNIPDKATLALWVKDLAKFEAALAEEAKYQGGNRKKKAKNRMSLNVGRIRTHTAAEREVVGWINYLRSDGISVRVLTRIITNKAVELNPNSSGRGRRHPTSRATLSTGAGSTSGARGFSISRTAFLCEPSPAKARNFLSADP